jgi:hypothetical protein
MQVTPTDLLEPAEPLTPAEALEERERLREDLTRLAEVAEKSAIREREIEAEVRAIESELSEQRMEAARWGETVSEADARIRLTALEVEAADVAGSIEAARVMRRKVELELHYLHVQQFEAFADHAEELGAEAARALEELRPLYENAVRLHNEARNEWEPLVQAHNEGRVGSPGPIIRPDGSVRTPEDALPPLSSAPPCPLPPVDEVFGGYSVRPPELEVEADPK